MPLEDACAYSVGAAVLFEALQVHTLVQTSYVHLQSAFGHTPVMALWSFVSVILRSGMLPINATGLRR